MFGKAGDPSRTTIPVTMSPPAAVLTAAGLFGAICVARFFDNDPGDAVSVLYVLPVGLVAASLGAIPGIIAGAVGMLLLAVWAAITHPQLHLLGWLSRATALLLLGGLLGYTADRLRSSQRRFAATLESMLDPFMVFEPIEDLDGRLVDIRPVYANAVARRDEGLARRGLTHPLVGAGGHVAAAVIEGLRRTYESCEPLVLDGVEVPGRDGVAKIYDVRAFRVDDMLACTWRDVTHQRDLQRALMAKREAGDINDSIVQRLAVAKWMLEAGNTEKGMVMVGETMEVAQRLVTELLDGDISSGVLLPVAGSAGANAGGNGNGTSRH